MTWQNNLLNNLLVVSILATIALIIYLKVKSITLIDFYKQIKEIFTIQNETVQ